MRHGLIQPVRLPASHIRAPRVRSLPVGDIIISNSGSCQDCLGPAGDGAQITKPRRRRRPADGDSHAKNQSFYFVDSSSSSKEKRAHVMRHHVQEKRKQRKVSHGTIPTEHLQELSSWSAGQDSRYDAGHQKEAASVSPPGTLVDQDSSVWKINLCCNQHPLSGQYGRR